MKIKGERASDNETNTATYKERDRQIDRQRDGMQKERGSQRERDREAERDKRLKDQGNRKKAHK